MLSVDNDLNSSNSLDALQFVGYFSLIISEEVGLELPEGLLEFEEV